MGWNVYHERGYFISSNLEFSQELKTYNNKLYYRGDWYFFRCWCKYILIILTTELTDLYK